MKKQQEEDRGPGARKTKIERHLNANAEVARRNFSVATDRAPRTRGVNRSREKSR